MKEEHFNVAWALWGFGNALFAFMGVFLELGLIQAFCIGACSGWVLVESIGMIRRNQKKD